MEATCSKFISAGLGSNVNYIGISQQVFGSGPMALRHPVGPNAMPFLGWRTAMNDEEWVNWGALDDDAWYGRVRSDFGLDAHPQRSAASCGRLVIRLSPEEVRSPLVPV
jgi:hypothetical protein